MPFHWILIPILLLSSPFILTPLRRWIWYVLISIALLSAYIFAIVFLYTTLPELSIALGLALFVLVVVSGICYLIEDDLREREVESFYDRRLFFRYGVIVKRDVVPIGTKDGTTEEQIAELINRLYLGLFEKLDSKFSKDSSYFRKIIRVVDSNKKFDDRYFIKVIFGTLRGSALTIMINSKKIGNQLIVTSLSFIRFTPKWYQGLLFVTTAPFHYWFWIYHWVFGKFSIMSFIGQGINNNSFDIMDIEGYLKSATFTLLTCIEDFAKENDLFTEELKQMIIQQISNTQNINIAKSRGVKIGNIEISSQKLKK